MVPERREKAQQARENATLLGKRRVGRMQNILRWSAEVARLSGPLCVLEFWRRRSHRSVCFRINKPVTAAEVKEAKDALRALNARPIKKARHLSQTLVRIE